MNFVKTRKALSILLAVTMLMSMLSVASAAQTKASEHFTSYDAYIEPVGGGDIEIHFEIRGAGTMQDLGVSRIILQESSDGKVWSNTKTFYSDDFEEMMASKTSIHKDYIKYEGIAKMQYRAYVTFYAHNGTTSDTRATYTSTITAY